MWPGSSWFSEKKFINSSNVENPMKKKESEELEQIERHFEDEKIYFKQVNLFGCHMDCFSDQEINKTRFFPQQLSFTGGHFPPCCRRNSVPLQSWAHRPSTQSEGKISGAPQLRLQPVSSTIKCKKFRKKLMGLAKMEFCLENNSNRDRSSRVLDTDW